MMVAHHSLEYSHQVKTKLNGGMVANHVCFVWSGRFCVCFGWERAKNAARSANFVSASELKCDAA